MPPTQAVQIAHPGLKPVIEGHGEGMQIAAILSKIIGAIAAVDLVFVENRVTISEQKSRYLASITQWNSLVINEQRASALMNSNLYGKSKIVAEPIEHKQERDE